MTAAAALITTRFAGPGVNIRLPHSHELIAPDARGDIRAGAGLPGWPGCRPRSRLASGGGGTKRLQYINKLRSCWAKERVTAAIWAGHGLRVALTSGRDD